MSTETHTQEKFWEMISSFKDCMLVTREGSKMRARPMQPHVSKDRKSILFVTDGRANKCQEVDKDNETCVTFSTSDKWVSVSGRSKVSKASDLKDEVWDKQAEAWMAQGKDDPEVAVMVVEPYAAEMWYANASKPVALWEFGKAYMGLKDRPDIAANEKVAL